MRYSPYPAQKYRIVTLKECEVSIVLEDGESAWNLFWLSHPIVDRLVGAGEEWYTRYKTRPGLMIAVIKDVNQNLALRRYLIEPPGVFLRWFERQKLSRFECYKLMGPVWAHTVYDRAEEAMFRLNKKKAQVFADSTGIKVLLD
jgi:hypothetical protein